MSEQNNSAFYQIIRGFPCPAVEWFTRKNIEDAMDFVPGDGDIIITSYPKTGTTWMQYIVLQIQSKGEYFPSFDDVTSKIVPFLEMVGVAAVEAQTKPRFYKHHLAYDTVQKNSKSKCIYTYRHPEDTVVSFYHFMKNLGTKFKLDFNQLFDAFLSGKISYGNYFQHVLSFYKHHDDENLLMVSYEKLHANRREEILRIAQFLDEKYYNNLLNDEQSLLKIIEHTSFDYMKNHLTLTHPNFKSGVKEKSPEDEPPKVNFFRKGIVGDGKTVLTESQRQQLKESAEKILKGTSILDEWYPK